MYGVCVLHSTTRVRTLLGSEDVLAGPQNVRLLFEGEDVVLGLMLELGLGEG